MPKSHNNFMGWIKEKKIYTVRFEHLVGPQGGGSRIKQINEIICIAKHIGVKITIKMAKKIAINLFGNSATFRKGQIGSWKQYFNKAHIEQFKKECGKLLIDLGYEKDFNW